MLSFFKRRDQNQDVLTDLKTVTRWVQNLPSGDIYSAQEKVVQNLIQFNHMEKTFNKDRLQVLMHLDEETREMQASLCLQYLRNIRMSKSIEARLWMAIHAFYWEITRSYHSFLMDFVANPGGSKIQSFIPLICARAIRGFADIIKWRYFRYEQIDEKLWLRLHNLYRIAEFDNFDTTLVMVYRGDATQHSPAGEYGQALLLSLFGCGNLLTREIEMVDRWLDNWSDLISIDNHYEPSRHTFYVDTSKGYGLRRCRNQGTDPTLRFISTTPLLNQLDKASEALKSGATPASLGLTEDFRLPEGYTLLNQVEAEWAALSQRDRRHSTRQPKSGHWKIVRDLANICNVIAKLHRQTANIPLNQASPEAILDLKLYGFVTERTKQQQLEREREMGLLNRQELWEQMDSSDNGLGFTISLLGSEWAKVGKLLALREGEQCGWQLGVISRLARQTPSQRLIGVRLFAGDFQIGTIDPDSSGSGLSYVVDEEDEASRPPGAPVILLTQGEGNETLILDSAKYARDRQYLLRPHDKPSRLIRLDSVEESGESWLRVNFKVIAI